MCCVLTAALRMSLTEMIFAEVVTLQPIPRLGTTCPPNGEGVYNLLWENNREFAKLIRGLAISLDSNIAHRMGQ
jgi:hypothetical protein